jgi:hypothetical protein
MDEVLTEDRSILYGRVNQAGGVQIHGICEWGIV